jgi:hypothetical protein
MTKQRIKDPERVLLAARSLQRSLALYEDGSLPECIQGWMLAIPAQRLMCGIYGSDLKAAAAMLRRAIKGRFCRVQWALWAFWQFRVLMRNPEADFEMEEMPVEKR